MTPARLAAELLRRHSQRVGADIAVDGEGGSDQAISVRVADAATDTVLIERAAHPTEGGPATRRARLSMTDAEFAEASIGAAVTSLALLQRRAAELDGSEPPWSFSISTMTSTAVRYLGHDPACLAVPGLTAAWGRRPAGNCDVDEVDVRLVGSRVLARSVVIPAAGRAPELRLDETTGLPALTIRAPLPESLIAALPGRRLGEVIEHPAVPADPVILCIRPGLLGAPEMRLMIEDAREPVAPPPRGVDIDWLGADGRSRYHPLFT